MPAEDQKQEQGGIARVVAFDHQKHATCADKSRTLLLGEVDA